MGPTRILRLRQRQLNWRASEPRHHSNGSGGGVVSPTSPLSPVGVGLVNGMPMAMGFPVVGGFTPVGVNGNGMPYGAMVGGVPMGMGMPMPMQVQGGVNGGAMGMGVNGGVNGGGGGMQYAKEYSIFVGDLAPETSNSDLVAVFRNPVLGLRNDRAPKFIRPFASCKSAKIMLDPVTGVSRGYGFVRFTDEADQQRALIEMHGLYCLSRPMRISPATAKFKPPLPELGQGAPLTASASVPNYPSVSTAAALPTSVSVSAPGLGDQQQQQQAQQAPSVSAPIAVPVPVQYYPGAQGQQGQGEAQPPAYTPGGGASVGGGGTQEYFAQYGVQGQQQQQQQQDQGQGQPGQQMPAGQAQGDEWRHTAQARAILGSLIGEHGEQLTSSDPYNTTVFVGGLSPLVGEETLRTFFVPFGEIHYVKVPVGKHCGFVQFVKKADANRAIEKMQGFPVGGSRIRLSWGRSQYKAAQAAAQAAQAAALQAAAQAAPPQPPPQSVASPVAVVVPQAQAAAVTANVNASANANGGGAGITPQMLQGMTQEQAIMLLQNFGMQGYATFPVHQQGAPNAYAPPPNGYNAPAPTNANANANGGYAPVAASSNSNNGSNNGNGADAYRNGGFHSSSPSNSNGSVVEAYTSANAGAPQPPFTDESLKVRRDEGPFGYPQRAAYEVPPPANSNNGGSSFSPFSPDPNQHQPQQQGGQQQQQQGMGGLYAAAELLGKRRSDSYVGAPPYGVGLPHPSKAYAPGFFPVPPTLQTPVNISVNGGSGSGGGGRCRGAGARRAAGMGAVDSRGARLRSRSIAIRATGTRRRSPSRARIPDPHPHAAAAIGSTGSAGRSLTRSMI
ncbi:hypothetical protein B0H13DRAFT_1707790 [Mycena leptocephala]|nr:hypothetical protein B0H13DRAFT_1707790 [Mycena leptocephala]